jgi:hypothetical protein
VAAPATATFPAAPATGSVPPAPAPAASVGLPPAATAPLDAFAPAVASPELPPAGAPPPAASRAVASGWAVVALELSLGPLLGAPASRVESNEPRVSSRLPAELPQPDRTSRANARDWARVKRRLMMVDGSVPSVVGTGENKFTPACPLRGHRGVGSRALFPCRTLGETIAGNLP